MKTRNQLVLSGGAGALVGLVVWAYDYDFFLNAGGPATPLTEAILRITRLQGAGSLVRVLGPLVVLMGFGVIIGAALNRLAISRQQESRQE